MESTAPKKKNSRTGEASRFQNTVLGIDAISKPIKIDGDPTSITALRHAVTLEE